MFTTSWLAWHMTETRTEIIELTDGRSVRLTIAEPDRPVRGGLVVLHEARGVTDVVRGLVSSLADEGWLAVAPNLFGSLEEGGGGGGAAPGEATCGGTGGVRP